MLKYRVVNDRLVMELSGELEMFTVSKFNDGFARALAESPTCKVVLDLQKLEVMDSCGLGALVSALKLVTARGGFMHLARMKSGVMELLYLTKLERRFRLFNSLEEALMAPAPAVPTPSVLAPAPAA